MRVSKTILISLALIGMFLWNIPNTSSIFYGQHTFYNGSAPCQKCHEDISLMLEQSPIVHQNIGCQGCHSRDGNISHAANVSYCSDCHTPDLHQINYPNCRQCHESHGAQILGISHGNNNTCLSCHVIHR